MGSLRVCLVFAAVFAAVTLPALAAPPVSGECTPIKACSTNSDCITGTCCNNECQSSTGNKLGELCGSGLCSSSCSGSPYTSCASGLCERNLQTHAALGCACQADSWCLSGICVGGVCAPSNVPAGGQCSEPRQCEIFPALGGTTECSANVCQTRPAVDSATGYASVCSPGQSQCPAGTRCVKDPMSIYHNCTTPRPAGGLCTFDYDCEFGHTCNTTSSTCIAIKAAVEGAVCSEDIQCESENCHSTLNVCTKARASVPDGESCKIGGNFVCRYGSTCVGTREPVCRRVAPTPCDFYQGGVGCPSGALCACSGTSGVCTTISSTAPTCAAETLAVQQRFEKTSSSLTSLFLNMDPTTLTADEQGDIARYLCCVACTGGSISDLTQYRMSFKLVGCGSANPRLESVDNTALGRCSATELVNQADAIPTCPNYFVGAAASPEESTFEKNKGAIIGGGVVGGLLVLGIIGAVVFVVLKGASTPSSSATKQRPQPAADPAPVVEAKAGDTLEIDTV